MSSGDRECSKRELLEQLWAMEKEQPTRSIRQSSDLLAVLQKYAGRKQEEFIVITLDGGHNVIKIRAITKGLLNRTVVHPREVFRPAIADNAAAVILAHNHPSGTIEPSSDDDAITRQLKDAGAIIGIPVLDHLIVARTGYYSYADVDRL